MFRIVLMGRFLYKLKVLCVGKGDKFTLSRCYIFLKVFVIFGIALTSKIAISIFSMLRLRILGITENINAEICVVLKCLVMSSVFTTL